MELDFSGKLSFKEIDLTAPDIVVREILSQLPSVTRGYVSGTIASYSGHIESYEKVTFSAIAQSLGQTTTEIDIQDSLGAIGETSKKFECYINATNFDHYKYRLFFMEYNVSHYPVKVVVERSIVNSFSKTNRGYIFSCQDRSELENLVIEIMSCKKAILVMQELIRIAQINNKEKNALENEDTIKVN